METKANTDLSRITLIPGQRSGQPCIRGLRVTVWDVLDMLASGMSENEILKDYPYLEKADFTLSTLTLLSLAGNTLAVETPL